MATRWDLVGGATGLAVAGVDIYAFHALGDLDVARLAASVGGALVLASFVLGYGLVGFVTGRLYLAHRRSLADAARIAAQLDALERGRHALLQSEKLAAIGRLAAGIAHEVRNPLGVIKASASLVRDGLEPSTDDHRACELIVGETDRLDGLIGALLAFAKPSRVTVRDMALAPALAHAKALAEEVRPGFEVTVDADAGARVHGDEDLVTQLVLGLLVNAAEAGASSARVDAWPDGPRMTVRVSDDGPGVPGEDAAQIFEPFFTTKPGGTGLGLAMAARIVEAHGGRLDLTPSEAGATFVVQLPMEPPHHGAAPDEEAA